MRLFRVMALIAAVFLIFIPLSGRAETLTTLKIGYIPNMWFMAPVIAHEKGWDKDAGLNFELTRFPAPPPMVQAFATGKLDIAYNNTASLLVLPEHGVTFKIIAASVKDDISLIGRGDFATLSETKGVKDAALEFVHTHKQKVKLVSNAKGTLSNILLTDWVERTFPDGNAPIEIIAAASQDQFLQLLLTKAVDGGTSFEPLYSRARSIDPSVTLLLKAGDLYKDQTGSVVAVPPEFLKAHPDEAVKFLAVHIRAIDFMRDHPQEAAKIIQKNIGDGDVPEAIILSSLSFLHDKFVSDATEMVQPLKKLATLMKQQGAVMNDVDTDALFDLTSYTKAKESHESVVTP